MPKNIENNEVVAGYGTCKILEHSVSRIEKVDGKYLVDVQVISTTMPPIGTKFEYLGYTWRVADIEYTKATPDSYTELTLEVDLMAGETN